MRDVRFVVHPENPRRAARPQRKVSDRVARVASPLSSRRFRASLPTATYLKSEPSRLRRNFDCAFMPEDDAVRRNADSFSVFALRCEEWVGCASELRVCRSRVDTLMMTCSSSIRSGVTFAAGIHPRR